MKTASLGDVAGQFAVLSLVAFGGANAVVPEIHRQSVSLHHWMSDAQFANLFAIAQAAPGPNVMISTLVGWKAAGIAGALVATLAMCAPSCFLTYFAAGAWERYRATRWRAALGAGLAPVTVGLVVSSAWLLAQGADRQWRLFAVTAAVAVAAFASKLNPLWLLAAAAGLGLAGALG
ncbi:MAG: chromate transporter [Caulobacteraceae bacterium]